MSKVLLAYEDYSEMLNIQSVLKKVGFDVITTSNEFSLPQQVLEFNPDIIIGYGKGPKVSTLSVGRRLKEMPRWVGRVVLIFPAGIKADPAELAKIRMDMALEAPLEVTRLLQVLGNYTNQDSRELVERMMKAVAQEGQQRATAPAKNDEAMVVSGAKEAIESWNVRGGKEMDEFNRMMGISTEPAMSIDKISGTDDPRGSGPTRISDPPKGKGVSFPIKSEAPPLHDAADLEALKKRVQGYGKLLEDLPPPPVQGHRRVDMKKAQKDLQKDWPQEELESQDELRRQFTKHLFKKKD